MSIDAGKNWEKWNDNFPTVPVKDLVIQEREDDLVIGTFGRAAWVLDDINPLRTIAKNNNILSYEVALFEAPTAYRAAYQQPTGSRFGADAIFNGENKEYGARIMYYFKKDESLEEKDLDDDESEKGTDNESAQNEEKAIEGKHKDSIYLKIYDGERLIRSLNKKIPDSTGIYSWRWFMNEAGGDRPSRKIKERKDEPSGASVKPGVYHLEINYLDYKSSNTIEVESDPRLTVSEKAINETYQADKDIEKLTQIVADVVKQLVESKKVADSFKNELSEDDKEKYKDLIKLSKEVSEKSDSLIDLYIGKEDKRQGITSSPDVSIMQRIGSANWYSTSRPNGLTKTETTLINQAKNRLEVVLKETNLFFETDWESYKMEMNKLDLSPFKKTQSYFIKEN